MKKIIAAIVFVGLISGLIAAQTIQVNAPKAGQIWYQGEQVQIKWTQSACDSPYMKINIFKDSIAQANFVTQLHPHNSGWTYWNIPGDLPTGKYYLRIKSDPVIGGCVGDSGAFYVKKKLNLTPVIKIPELKKKPVIDPGSLLVKIQVTHPEEGAKVEGGKAMNIQWNKNFTTDTGAQVKITLHNVQNMNKLEDISLYTSNDGSFSWTPSISKYSWPGTKYTILISTTDHKFEGQSGTFTIFAPATGLPEPPAPEKNKVIAISPEIKNEQKNFFSDSGEPECLSMGLDIPGRWAEPKELKTGHYKHKKKGVKCGWRLEEYYFFSLLDFDISPARGKNVVRAELMLWLSGTDTNYSNQATNAYCNSQSRILYNDTLQKTFSIFEDGEKVKVDLLQSVKDWAASGSSGPYRIKIAGMFDSLATEQITCLRYYKGMILFVEYKE